LIGETTGGKDLQRIWDAKKKRGGDGGGTPAGFEEGLDLTLGMWGRVMGKKKHARIRQTEGELKASSLSKGGNLVSCHWIANL